MTPDPVAVGPATPLRDVAQKLVEHCISGMPVRAPDGRVLGVVSERDLAAAERVAPREASLLGRLLDPSPNAAQPAVEAGDAMTAPPVTICCDRPISDAAAIMRERSIHRLPVVEPDGRLVGIVTRADLERVFARDDALVADETQRELDGSGTLTADELGLPSRGRG